MSQEPAGEEVESTTAESAPEVVAESATPEGVVAEPDDAGADHDEYQLEIPADG